MAIRSTIIQEMFCERYGRQSVYSVSKEQKAIFPKIWNEGGREGNNH